MNIEQKLLKMKRIVDNAKQEKARLEGSLSTVMKSLKDDFNVLTVEAAEEYLEELKKEEKLLSKELDAAIAKLEKDYDWDES